MTVTLLVPLLVLLATGAGVTFVRLGRRRAPEPALAAPLPAPRPATPPALVPPLWRHGAGRFARTTPAPNGPAPVITLAASSSDPAEPTAGGEPPDPARAWTAEIEWSEGQADGVFRVVARPAEGAGAATIAESARHPWPPKGPESVERLRQAANELEASVLAAGWKPLAPGHAWYAKRFAWTAAPAQPSLATGRFQRGPEWPEETLDLWRCEIKWSAGYIVSSFKATAYPPDRKRGRTVGESARFKWMIMGPPDPHDPETVAELRRLASALVAAGWEPAGRGADWYSGRYVWRGSEPPPGHVELAPAEGGTAS